MATRVWLSALLLAFLLATSPFVQVARAQSEEEAATAEVVEGADLGIVGDDTQVSSDGPLSPAPGVETVCVFPKNAGKVVPAGEETELLVGLQNEGESTLNVVAIHSTLHLPFDHRMYGQNLTVQELHEIPLFFSLHSISGTVKCTSPSAVMFRSAVLNAGYQISSTHINPLGLKSDAPWDVIWDIMRCWVENHPIKEQPHDSPGTAILSKSPKL